jgi:virulence factor Mce-like protein
VEIAGVKIGEVQSVAARGNLAVASLQIGQQYSDIHSDATVYLRAHGLFGPKYVSIEPGTASAPRLRDGDSINVRQTVQPVDLNAILQDLQRPEQQNLRTLFIEFGKAAAGRGDDVNHLLAAANSLTKVLDSPLRAVGTVSPQLSDMLVTDESFNEYFAQAPLDQLVANSEATWRAFAANAGHVESLLSHANSTLTQLDTALNGQPSNLANIIQALGKPGGTIDKLNRFTYTLALFGANLTGKEASLGTDPASQDVTQAVIHAITNVASAFTYSNDCPLPAWWTTVTPDRPLQAPPGATAHCAASPDGREHYLDTDQYHYPPQVGIPNCTFPPQCPVNGSASTEFVGDRFSNFTSLFAS